MSTIQGNASTIRGNASTIRGNVDSLLQEQILKVGQIFAQEYSPFMNHVDPQNLLVKYLQEIIEESKPMQCVVNNLLHQLTLTNVRMSSPVYIDRNEIPHQLLVEQARERNMSYSAPVVVDVIYRIFRKPGSNTTLGSNGGLAVASGPSQTSSTTKSRKRQKIEQAAQAAAAAALHHSSYDGMIPPVPVFSASSSSSLPLPTPTLPTNQQNNNAGGSGSGEQIALFTELLSTQTFTDERIGFLPVMLYSRNCHRSMKLIGSASSDQDTPGFCIGGTSKIIAPLRHLRVNRDMVFKSKPARPGWILQVRSIHERFQFRSTSTLTIYYSKYNKKDSLGGRIMEVSIPFVKKPVPVVIVFLALGWPLENIYFAIRTMAGAHWHAQEFNPLVETLCHARGTIESQTDALLYISVSAGKDQKDRHQCISYAQHTINSEFLPHVGLTDTSQEQYHKGLILGFFVWRLFMVSTGHMACDDRDHMGNIAYETGATLMASLFRQIYSSVFAKQAQNIMYRTLEKQNTLILRHVLNEKKITGQIVRCMATGNWCAQKGAPRSRKNVSQPLTAVNARGMYSHYMRLASTLKPDGKHIDVRRTTSNQFGRICPNETPEGRQCGLVCYAAFGTHLSIGSSPSVLARILLNPCYKSPTMCGLYDLNEWTQLIRESQDDLEQLNHLYQVWITGYGILGWVKDPKPIVGLVRRMRRESSIDQDTSIYVDETFNMIRIDTDKERLMRPLLVTEKFHELSQLNLKHETLSSLIMKGFIEFVDAWEETNLTIAFTEKDRLSRLGKHKVHCTHMEVDPSFMLGLSTGLIPFPDFNQSPRNSYQAAMGKHSTDVNSNPNVMHKSQHDLFHVHRPLVSTMVARSFGDELQMTGINCRVAIMSYRGLNEEDGSVWRKGFLQLGAFDSITRKLYRDDQRRFGSSTNREEFGKPDPETTVGMKDASYDHILANGTAEMGSIVFSGDPVIGKTTPVRQNTRTSMAMASSTTPFLAPASTTPSSTSSSNPGSPWLKFKSSSSSQPVSSSSQQQQPPQKKLKRRRDGSTTYRGLEPAMVTRTLSTTNAQNLEICKVILSASKSPEIGDKFSSRHGQKGVMVHVVEDEDMPFDEFGHSPDIIINQHCIPTRMTNGNLLEAFAGTYAAIQGEVQDGTINREMESRLEMWSHRLHELGFHPDGEIMYKDGTNGEYYRATVFTGMVHIQKLKHLVLDKMHARATGPKQLLIRQPNEGRSNDGGQRFGEMERDVIIAYGASELMLERLCRHSDIHNLFICMSCGLFATGNRAQNVYYCHNCNRSDSVRVVQSCWSLKVVCQELMSMGIRVKFALEDIK